MAPAPKKKKRPGAPAGPEPADINAVPVEDGASPPMAQNPPGLDVPGLGGPPAPMADGGPMMAPPGMMGPGQFPSTDPGMMLAAMSRLMDADHQSLAMQQMQALQQIGPMAAQAIARASGMAESVDVPGGPAGMMP